MRIYVQPPHGPVTIRLKDGQVRYYGKPVDVDYVQMLVEDQAGPLGHSEGQITAFDVERRVFAAFGDAARLLEGKSELLPALNRARFSYLKNGRIP